MRVIDLSMVTSSDPSPLMNVKLTHLSHIEGALEDQKYFGIYPEDWPNPGMSYADDFVAMTTHAGTHMDSPWHMTPVCEGKLAKSIDEWPLNWCIGNGVVVDIRDVPDGVEISKEDLIRRMDEMNYQLKPGDIFLTMTGNDKLWGKPEYSMHGGHLGREALRWVLDQGIKTVGTDSWSFDRAYEWWSKDYLEHDRDPKYLWPCHLLCIDKEYAHIEKLANLDTLPTRFGFTFMAFPIKFSKGSAGFVRAVALIDDGKEGYTAG
jgi:kynurenine formamidase